MSVVDRLLNEKPEDFEEASQNTVDRVINRGVPRVSSGASRREVVQQIPTVPARAPLGMIESFKQGFIEDPGIRIQRIAQEKFPDDPEALKRFGIVNGDIVFLNDAGELEKAQGGVRDFAGTAASLSPEIAGGIVGSFATGHPGLGAAFGASGGRALKEIIGGVIFDDPKTTVGVLQNIGLEFATDLVAGGIGKGVVMTKERKALQGITDAAFKSEAKREQIKNATGIELDLAQVTNLPKLKALKIWARNFPGDAGEIIRANDEMVAGQVDEAIERLLDVVSKSSSNVASGARGINAAGAAIEAARATVADATRPLYTKAFTEVGPDGLPVKVDIDPVYDLIDEKLKTAKGGVAAALRETRRFLNVSGTTQRDTTVKGLHGSKLAIDNLLEGDVKTSVGRTAKRELAQVKNALLEQMSASSPAYDAARREFDIQTQAIVDPLRDGIIGVLAKVKDTRAASAASKMFADGNVTLFDVNVAKKAITETAGEETWNGLVRQYLNNQFNRASREIQVGDEVNLAGKFRQAVIGTRNQKKIMMAAVGPEARELFDITMEALQSVARTPTNSSATEFNRLITKEIESNSGSIMRGVLQPRQTGIRAIEDRHLQTMSRQIAEALTDPSKKEQLRILAEMKPSQARAIIAASVIGLSIIPRDVTGRIMFPDNDIIPPALLEMQ